MSRVKFFNFNLITNDATELLSVSSEDAFYPATNILSPFTTKVFRTQNAVTTAEFVYDFKTLEPVDHVLVRGSSLNNFGFTQLDIYANGTNNFAAPAFSTTLTPNVKFNFGHVSFAEQNLRFWKFVYTTTGNFVEVSKLFVGKGIFLENNNIDFGWSLIKNDNAKITTNRYGQRFIDVINKTTGVNASIRLLNKDEFDTVMDIFEENGKTVPMWMIVDDTETIVNDLERFAFYGYLDNIPNPTNSAFGLYDLSFRINEEP